MEALKIAPAKYPINRTEVKQFSIPKDSLDAFIDNAVVGQLPRRAFVALVPNDAANGSLTKDPFRFEHFKVNFMACYYNSIQYPSKAFKPDFSTDMYAREFISLFEATNQIYGDTRIDISHKNYKDGNTIFAFNFAPDLSDDCNTTGYSNVINKGNMRIEMHFADKLTESVTVLLYLEFDSIIQVGEERNALLEK